MPPEIQDWEGRIGRRVTLRDLHILLAVVRSGSMAKAAAQLSMSQSSISESIAHLEDAVRVRLLDRSPQGITPTIYADVLLKRGHAVFDELKQGIKDIEFLADPTTGEIRVGCPEILSYGILPLAIDRLSRRHPRIAVRVFQIDTESLEFDLLQQREVDLVITRMSRSYTDQDLDTEVLFGDSWRVIVGIESEWARWRKGALRHLVDAPWVLPPTPVVRQVVNEVFESQGLKAPAQQVTGHSIQLRLRLVSTGRFVSIVTDWIVHEYSKRWGLKALPIEFPVSPLPWSLVTLKNRTVGPAVRLFVDALRDVAVNRAAP
jgi:DNA-binding transcriptional LysR family regulator